MKNEANPVSLAGHSGSRRRCHDDAQLDLVLAAPTPVFRRVTRPGRPCSRERARWWFNQMRQAVEEGRTVNVAGVF